MSFGRLFILLILCGCVSDWRPSPDFNYKVIEAGGFDIVTWGKLTDNVSPVHIYIEGDGHSFDSHGFPTADPTPRSTFMRDLAMSDTTPNVVYVARPCQFIMSETCKESDWTDGRFSKRVVDSMASVVRKVSDKRSIILVGYSGGAMITGLIIDNYPDLNVQKWITIAGVLNHKIWTDYFGDSPLKSSMYLDKLPNMSQRHYVAKNDKVVPISLTFAVANPEDIVVVENATHDNFGQLKLDFSI